MASSAQPAATAWARARHLRHGINASEWFAQSKDYSPQRLGSYTTLDDIAKIRQMGFDHVRLSIDPVIFDCPTAWEQCERVQILDQVIRKALSLELAVILDMHPGAQYKKGLAASDNAVEQLAILWGRIAAYYATLISEWLPKYAATRHSILFSSLARTIPTSRTWCGCHSLPTAT